MPRDQQMNKCLRIFMMLATLIIMAGCFSPKPSVMRVGTNLWPGYEPLYLAKQLHYLDSQQVRLVEYPSATEVIRAFRNNTLEAATLTLDEVLSMRADKINAVVILVLDISHGGDVIIANHGLDDFIQLKNKTIAVESSALGAYVLSRALELNQMTLDQVKIKALDFPLHEQAFFNGEVDAAVTYEPMRTKLINYGGKEVFSSKQIPGEIIDVLVVKQDYLDNHQANVKLLIDSWFQAIAFIEQSPQQAAHVIAKRLKISSKEVSESYQGLKLCDLACNLKMLDNQHGSLEATALKLANTMLSNNLLTQQPPINNLFKDELLKR